jgi:hypothetical protein
MLVDAGIPGEDSPAIDFQSPEGCDSPALQLAGKPQATTDSGWKERHDLDVDHARRFESVF